MCDCGVEKIVTRVYEHPTEIIGNMPLVRVGDLVTFCSGCKEHTIIFHVYLNNLSFDDSVEVYPCHHSVKQNG